MDRDDAVKIVDNAEAVLEWFGFWPTFHDAEVLTVALRRDLPSTIEILTALPRVRERAGELIAGRATVVVVTFTFGRVVDVRMEDFSTQNVIASLLIALRGDTIRVEIYPSFGIGGYIETDRLSVGVRSVDPGSRDGSP